MGYNSSNPYYEAECLACAYAEIVALAGGF